jgi:murein DD-endopeptidase MepM/ murein hydrolase activator NlpD
MIDFFRIMKRNKFSSFLQKIRFKYRVSILNENTLEESWHVRLSRLSVFIYLFVFTLLTFVLLSFLIYVTPLRHYLPGYGDTGDRAKIIQESMRADSLTRAMELQAGYLEIIKEIVEGKIKPDSVAGLDSVALQQQAQKLIEKSKKEKEFCEKFEDEEKFSLSSMEDNHSGKTAYVFFRPVNGTIVSTFDLSKRRYGISIQTLPNTNVSSVLSGTVIFSGFTFDDEWVIEVQHQDNYISVYKNNDRLLKNVGEVVRAGEPVAITGSAKDKANNGQFYFELWQQGKPVNPQDLIIF